MSSNLTVKQGIYDPLKRFAFTNITDDVFTFKWADKPIDVPPHTTIELPHHLAILATGRLVDQIMLAEARIDEIETRKVNRDPYWRSPKGISVGIPEARRPYEEKVLKELEGASDSPQFRVLQAEVRDQLVRDLSSEKAAPVDKIVVKPEEFAAIPQSNN